MVHVRLFTSGDTTVDLTKAWVFGEFSGTSAAND